jgi:predicted helicase
VDALLRKEFGLRDGLADTTTWGEMAELHKDLRIPKGLSPDHAFVQVLDPATGTGTFLVEVIDLIHKTMTENWNAEGYGAEKIEALWNEYVPKQLLARLHGYELLMAPYAIAHLKIGLKLYETGYRFNSAERARIYLTNAVEPPFDPSGTFTFALPALAEEARASNRVKQSQRFTVVLGNPPYSISSQNKGPWITSLLDFYKRGVESEPNLKPLSDDYVKFLRLAHHCLVQTQSGILGMITNNTYLDGPVFAGARRSLLSDSSALSVLNLHGDSLRREADLRKTDENVFDIRQGVAIVLFRLLPRESAAPKYAELVGPRPRKYEVLLRESCRSLAHEELDPAAPQFLLLPRDDSYADEYESYLPIKSLFRLSKKAILTKRDAICIHFGRESLERLLEDFTELSREEFKERYQLKADSRDWKYKNARETVARFGVEDHIQQVAYRPFDLRWTYFVDRTKGFMAYPVYDLLSNLTQPNLALCLPRQTNSTVWRHALVSRHIVEFCYVSGRTREQNDVFPAYLYSPSSSAKGERVRAPNLTPLCLDLMRERLGLVIHLGSGNDRKSEANPEDLLHYIYSVLSSNSYRTRYGEFLQRDFPRIPVPVALDLFWALADLGRHLADRHLLEAEPVDAELRPAFVDVGVNRVEAGHPRFVADGKNGSTVGRIHVNKAEYFQGVPKEVWDFHIGGYQVCHKWLKDRKGRTLSDDDIAHYQKIIVALNETIRIMGEIDQVIGEHGGWPGAFLVDNSVGQDPYSSEETEQLMVAEEKVDYGEDDSSA